MGPEGVADLVTSQSDPEDWLWKTVRKGIAPAFAAQALRYAWKLVAASGNPHPCLHCIRKCLSCWCIESALLLHSHCTCSLICSLSSTVLSSFMSSPASKLLTAPVALYMLSTCCSKQVHMLQCNTPTHRGAHCLNKCALTVCCTAALLALQGSASQPGRSGCAVCGCPYSQRGRQTCGHEHGMHV